MGNKIWQGKGVQITRRAPRGVMVTGQIKCQALIKIHPGQLDANSDDDMLTKLANLHAKCRNGTSFRWGASASVVSDDTFRIFTCERNVKNETK